MARPTKEESALSKPIYTRITDEEWEKIKCVILAWNAEDKRGISYTPSDVIRHFVRKGLNNMAIEEEGKKITVDYHVDEEKIMDGPVDIVQKNQNIQIPGDLK